jgi:ISXO2-like transposase domain
MCSSKKGISALQLQRELWREDEETKRPKGSYRTAWFMCHRIRWVMTQTPMAEKLKGIVEVDERYVGGKEIGSGHVGRNLSKKTPVLALVERGGNVRSFPLERATLKNIRPIMEKHIDPSSHFVTDEFPAYYMIRDKFASTPYNRSQRQAVRTSRGRYHSNDQHGRKLLCSTETCQLRYASSHEPQVLGFLLCRARLRLQRSQFDR